MAKSKKKRNKRYQGSEASLERPVVVKVSAANRNKLAQWWFDHKKIAKPVLIGGGVVILVIGLIIELVRIVGS